MARTQWKLFWGMLGYGALVASLVPFLSMMLTGVRDPLSFYVVAFLLGFLLVGFINYVIVKLTLRHFLCNFLDRLGSLTGHTPEDPGNPLTTAELDDMDRLFSSLAKQLGDSIDREVRQARELGAALEHAARLGRILDSSSNEIYTFDATTLRYMQVSRGGRQNLGYEMEELSGMTPLDLLVGFTGDGLANLLEPLLTAEHEQVRVDVFHRRKDGSTYPIEIQFELSQDESPQCFVAIGQDISERKQADEALAHQALYDALTELPNRNLLRDRLEQAVSTSRREGRPVAVLLMDLDRFKEVNDTFGHHYGDLLLKQVAARLRHGVRASDTVARLGGDEFAAVLPATGQPIDAVAAARKMLQALEKPFVVEGQTLTIGASIGIALYPDHADDAEA
ncbi:MAG: GGDEF domain-containing protein, partial [Chloroflexota bacterium]|nr:GGDEF domain-containing protein [Chloroflexota bacterium]